MIKIIDNKLLESYSPRLSCFWIINGELYGDEIKLKDAEANGDFLVTNSLHFLMWPSIKNLNDDFKDKDYDYYPRGRVRFNIKIQQAEVIADEKIASNDAIRDLIRDELGLLPTTIFSVDEHYASTANVYD